MAFCGYCGAKTENVSGICNKCANQQAQYYQPMPPPPADDAGRVMAIVALVFIIIIVVTVVLAAFLYVMVIGFGSSGTHSVAGSWQQAEALSDTTGKVTFGFFTEDIEYSEVRVFITANGSSAGYLEWTGGSDSIYWASAPVGASATYFDFNPSGGTINVGDYLTLSGLEPDTEYSFDMYHLDYDLTISMTGDDNFTTEP